MKHVDRFIAALREASDNANTYVLNARGTRLVCRGDGTSMRVVDDGDVVRDLGESTVIDDVEHRKVRLEEGFVGWVPWTSFEHTDTSLNEVTSQPWVVRGGETVLVRRSGGGRNSWKEHVLKKVTYFTDDELVSRPDKNWNGRTWVFQRGDWKCAVREEQFYAKPE